MSENHRSKRAHNNDKDGFNTPIREWCEFYGIHDMRILQSELSHLRPILTDRAIERLIQSGGEINQNQVTQMISIVGTGYTVSFYRFGAIDTHNLLTEQRVEKPKPEPEIHGKHAKRGR